MWSGSWVEDRLGVGLEGDAPLRDLLGLALRRNPKRAHLLVSHVLGKHVPVAPSTVHGSGAGLGRRVRALLGDADAARAVVLGYAETATGLGHAVADGLGLAPYLHSTRRPVPGVTPVGGFEEEHSHATSHLLLPEDPALLSGDGPLILVDDEFSTGRTVLNTITALHARFPRERYVIVALVDMRGPADRARLTDFAAELGARVDVLALASGTVRLPAGVLERGRALVAEHEPADAAPAPRGDGARQRERGPQRVELGWPAGVPDGGRHGFTPAHRSRLEAALPEMAARIAEALPRGARRVLVLGNEELMYAPLRLACALEEALGGPAEKGGRADRVRESCGGDGGDLASGSPDYAPGVPDDSRAPEAGRDGHDGGCPEAGRGSLASGSAATTPDFPGAGRGDRAGGHAGIAPGVPEGSRHAGGCVGTTRDGLASGPAEAGRNGHDSGRLGTGRGDRASGPAADAADVPGAPGAGRRHSVDVRFSTTTRSPVLAVDDPGYAIRTRIGFPAHDDPADGPGPRYAYNVAGAGFDAVVAVVDSHGDTPELHAPGGLLDALAPHTGHVLLAVVPSHTPEAAPAMPEPLRGPAFSSYAPEDVGWLLQDLSGVTLEAPTEEREEAIQSGGAHYAESLPVEYQPGAEYQALFRAALDASASRMARAVGVVTETVLAERSPRPVLVSLARAGTPVGVLMRRWARHAYGLDLPHYAVSIVRGRGIDRTALRWLAAHHDPADVVFVDGWTGKGAITRELADALAGSEGFDPRLAVLADPGHCVETYGTRDDFLIPSACLNSTVSGLISRTVLRSDLVGPHDFHGAKFYRELAGGDVSRDLIEAVAARFPDAREQVARDAKDMAAADRTPTWEGWAAVERISEEFGIHDVNLVKPGVGETTRVLLRRVPWKILARRGAGADLGHVRLLAAQRGVPVEEVDGLPYSCVGLIHPRYTRGATGADGTAVAAP
ncbi:phosphoribosyltransferase domain-containing protein [Streptomyces olivoreticuli]|uniref:phosphoribosyltransferase domain-containing protein n=1 Tax=Streptomyces olivoreticuli TaxID=68246 RepID=UPI000E254440|nr:phosphoribosyltransferase domain-containing protein [Streptomyces olivoreticuli]